MKTGPSPNVVSAPSQPPQGFNSLVQFWACFFLCLIALGIISGLMLAGLFLFMGYKVF
jgi:hypothetical protein